MAFQKIGPEFDATRFSDEYCQYGEFTGAMVGVICADFDFLEYLDEFSEKE